MTRDITRSVLAVVVLLLLVVSGPGTAAAGRGLADLLGFSPRAGGPEGAGPADIDGFRLWVDPVDLWILESDQDTNSSQFEEYRDMSGGLWAGLKLYGESADGNRTLAVRLAGIGRDDARYVLDYGLAGSYSLEVDYNKIPHRFGNDAVMYWGQPAPDRLEIPDPAQVATPETIQLYVDAADRIGLGLQRDRTRVSFDLGKLGPLAWGFEYKNENRKGSRPLGAAFGFGNVQEIPEPIDYQMSSAEIAAEINRGRGGVRFGYRYSVFENDNDTVTWDNIFNAVEEDRNPSRGRYDLAPDNEASLLFIDGRMKTDKWWYNGNLVYNQMSQDDPLVPYTVNTALVGIDSNGNAFPAASAGLPVTRSDNEAEILNLSANVGTEFGENWSLTFRYRYYDYDNTSPRIQFPGYVRLDERWEEDGLITVPYSYTRDNIGVELGWDVTTTTNLILSYGMETWDRTFRETEETEEDILKLSLNSRPNPKVNVRASWATGDRSFSGVYRTEAQLVFFVEPHGIDNPPELRKYDQAERDVDDYELAVQFFPSEFWNVSFGYTGRDEDYPDSLFGLVSDEVANFNFEIGYSPGAHFNFFLFGHSEDRDVFQRGLQSGRELSTSPLDRWSLLLNEDTMTWGLGLNGERENGWWWDIGVNISDTDGEGDFETPPGGSPSEAVDIDNYEDIELLSAWIRVRHEINDRVALGAFGLYEDYTINSFILQGLQPYLASTLLLVPNAGDYEATVFGVTVRVVF